jgi:glycosyltransferase involved in cell wall biosynthesis
MAADVAHWSYPVPLKLNGAANIYTIHDLVPLKLPDTTLDNKRKHFEMLKSIVSQADLVITVSEQSKKDIHEFFNVPDRKVVNTYQDVAVPAAMATESQESVANALSGIYGLEMGEYLLFYGAIEPKKNVGRLLEAYLSSGITIPLVIAGKDGWLVDDELILLDQQLGRRGLNGQSQVVRLPYVSRNQLVNLIRGARAVAFPSLYEGFGLPLVEAMICGTPVLTSDRGAMKEIAGDAALYVNPYEVSSIRDGLKKIAIDPVLRSDLVAAGLSRAANFSAAAYQSRLLDAYQRIV